MKFKPIIYLSITYLYILSVFPGFCQQDSLGVVYAKGDSVVLSSVSIVGHKRTKDAIVYRELSIKQGDRIAKAELEEVLKLEKNKLFNLSLFTEVNVLHTPDFESKDSIDVTFLLNEQWFYVASPIFTLADRSFNEWWFNQGAKLNRVEYGFMFMHENFRGRKENLKISFKFGFLTKCEIRYRVPYIDKKQKIGAGIGIAYTESKSLNYITLDHKIQSIRSEQLLRRKLDVGLSFNYRANFYGRHDADIKFVRFWGSDSLLVLNPRYFIEHQKSLSFPEISYSYRYDRRNETRYPTKGYRLYLYVRQRGIPLASQFASLGIYLRGSQHFTLSKRSSFSSNLNLFASGPSQQPYILIGGFGYGEDYVRGLDLYVIEGQCFALNRNEIRYKFFDKKFDFTKIIKFYQFAKIPVEAYVKLFFDQGYLYYKYPLAENTRLSNRYLAGWGVGIDIVSYYSFVFRIEYSFSNFGDRGYYFSSGSAI